ncbi:hypothetical protein MOMA_09011 [Moraxella macacae 0408225]|uniref:DUF4124 domain-containing protein n=1 Tax=Moraxella macacae 0408225 TaxID=1230338 RepID=L2F7E9_9GAMM|nr:DUF4124 domain-containing protein [Moraxella macacae]ELA08686.1 hypothetical protein MOMA_09011 [Moraxella macacae 0408225]
MKKIATPMFLTASLIVLGFGNLAHAEVYRAVTPDGKVVYTDDATKAHQYQADPTQIQILDLHSQTPDPVVNQPAAASPSNVSTDPIPISTSYQLNIVKPEINMVYRRPNDIIVEVHTRPNLQAGDRIVYRINGNHIATTQSTSYNISSLDYTPDRYTLSVEIENAKGSVIASQSRDFQLLVNNIAIQKKRKAEAEAKAKTKDKDKAKDKTKPKPTAVKK